MEAEIKRKELQIAEELRKLGHRLEAGDESELLVWVIPDKLACAHRPLRYHQLYGGSGKNIGSEAADLVVEWAEIMSQLYEIKSIICLMHESELEYYKKLDLGASNLIEFYRRYFQVRHIPWKDPRHSKTDQKLIEKKLKKVRQEALNAYNELSKPVLLHCSAGIQRSAPVAAYIWFFK